MLLTSYKTIIFDCDGVILNSNSIKKQAFYNTTIIYGQQVAEQLVDYHIKHGGKSRYEKFDYFFHKIIGRMPQAGEIDKLLSFFAWEVKKALMKCEIAPGLEELRKATKNSRWLVVSGGDQAEIREVFHARGIDKYFDSGIFGSPDDKDQILNRELRNGNIIVPAVYLGDSYYDYDAAKRAGLDFIFISGWSEFDRGKEYFLTKEIHVVGSIANLL